MTTTINTTDEATHKKQSRPDMMRAFPILMSFLAMIVLAIPAAAQQGLFAPRVIVNDRAITNYEVDQRMRFLALLRATGDLEEAALEALIEDRLRMDAAERLGVEVSDEEIAAGMEEFAGRANLPAEEFVSAIASEGVAVETFRDFVTAGLAWRSVIRARFAPNVRISEADIDRALASSTQSAANTRVLLSELIIPTQQDPDGAMALAARLSSSVRTFEGFAAAARQYSASGSRERGGRIDWLPLANLPPAIRPLILALAPGEVTDPIPIPDAVALFQLRALEEGEAAAPTAQTLEYAQFLIPGGRSEPALAEAARIAARVDTCNDLYGVAKGLPEERLLRETRPSAEIPGDIALELAKLDPGESSSLLTRGDALVFLMLCARQPLAAEDDGAPTRDDIRNRLLNDRLNGYANSYLAELRAEAIVRTP